MKEIESATKALRALDRATLEGLMLAVSQSHAAACRVASQEQEPHASDEMMKSRISSLDSDDLVAAIAPLAAVGLIVHEHHPEHGREHGH